MENQRTILYIAFFFTLFLLYQEWQKDYGPAPIVSQTEQSVSEREASAVEAEMSAIPVADVPVDTAEAGDGVPHVNQQTTATRQSVRVVTDVMDLMIDTQGGTVYQLDLRKYQKSADEMDKPFRLFSSQESLFHIAQSGLVSAEWYRT